jgi:hypothetical protein
MAESRLFGLRRLPWRIGKIMEVGKLYSVKQYFWLLFPSKDIAAGAVPAAAVARVAAAAAALVAAYWSSRLSCDISYISPKGIFMLLEQDGKYYKVLSTEGMVGWICFPEWWKEHIAEVKAE